MLKRPCRKLDVFISGGVGDDVMPRTETKLSGAKADFCVLVLMCVLIFFSIPT